MQKRFRFIFMICFIVSFILVGCSKVNNNNLNPMPSFEKPKVEIPSQKINASDEIIRQYEYVWVSMQGKYDNLKKSASVQPISEAQLESMKNELGFIKEDLELMHTLNTKLEAQINTPYMIQQVKAYNGKAQGLYNSAQAYVNSFKTDKLLD